MKWKTKLVDWSIHRSDFINSLIEKRGYKSYLEIGVRDTRDNFDNIVCDDKVAVDPTFKSIRHPSIGKYHEITSDEFFKNNTSQFDIIFIDGLHLEYQVTKDIDNSLKCLNKKGCIILDDCNPSKKEHQFENYPGRGPWNGTVWKSFVKKRRDPNLRMFTIDTRNGLGYIQKGKPYNLLELDDDEVTWDNFNANRYSWLNLFPIWKIKL